MKESSLLPPNTYPFRVPSLRAARWCTYIDDQGSLYSLIKGSSTDIDLNRICLYAHMVSSNLNLDIWYDYVPSASNLADLPTRLDDEATKRLINALGPESRVPLILPPECILSCTWSELSAEFISSQQQRLES